jgi:N-acetylmuramoyl-L-alanine amidase
MVILANPLPFMIPLCRILFVALFAGMLGTPVKGAGTVVVLDPGHGGRDRGTMWGGVSEKILTLSIARRVEGYLKSRGITTAMTRRTDVYRSLEGRAAMANGYRRSVFVSIHCNADPQFEARGIETFYSGAQGWRLASSIHGCLDTRTSTPDRGVKCAGFAVLRRTCCPAALVECGFLTSPGERRLLTTPVYQDRVARAIADGIARSVNR